MKYSYIIVILQDALLEFFTLSVVCLQGITTKAIFKTLWDEQRHNFGAMTKSTAITLSCSTTFTRDSPMHTYLHNVVPLSNSC